LLLPPPTPQQQKQKSNSSPTTTAESEQVQNKSMPNKKEKGNGNQKNAILNNAELIANNKNHPARLAGKSGKSPGRWVTAAD